jgi:hypothetical protein
MLDFTFVAKTQMKTRIYLLSILLVLIAQFLQAKPAYGVYYFADADGGSNDENVTRNLMSTIQVMPLVVPDSSGFAHSDNLLVAGETGFFDQAEPIKADLETMNRVGNCKRFQLRLLADVTVPAGAEKIIFQARVYDPVFFDDQVSDSRMIIFKLKPSASARFMKKGIKSIVELCESGRIMVISSKYIIGVDSLSRKRDGSSRRLDASSIIFFTSSYYDWVPLK